MTWTKNEIIVMPLALIITIFLAIFICKITKNKDEKIKFIPLQIISITMVVLEIIKQILSFENGKYKTWSTPLHFCSMFMFIFVLASFSKGTLKKFGLALSNAFSAIFFALFYVSPSGIIGNACDNIFANFFTFHTFIYHHLIILFFLIMIISKLYIPQIKDFSYVSIGLTTYIAIALPMAHILNVNFCTILYSNIPIMENIRLSLGQIPYTLILSCLGYFGLNAIVGISLIVKKWAEHKYQLQII